MLSAAARQILVSSFPFSTLRSEAKNLNDYTHATMRLGIMVSRSHVHTPRLYCTDPVFIKGAVTFQKLG